MTSTRTVALTATGALAVLAAAVIGTTAGNDHADQHAASTSSSSAAASPSASATVPGGVATPEATSPSSSAPAPSTPRPSSAPTGTTSGPVSEILPTPAGGPSATGYSLPPITTTEPAPLASGTMPEPGVAKGRLVAGFPTALAPPQGTQIESSSVSVDGDMLQAALVATGGDPQAVVLHYRELLTARGFVEKKSQGVENAPTAAFRKGRDNVTITTGDGKTYVLAHLRAKGATD